MPNFQYQNPYNPRTEIGAALANAIPALFNNRATPNDQAKLELDRQKVAEEHAKNQAYILGQQASAAKDNAEATDKTAITGGRANYPLINLRQAIQDPNRVNAIHNYIWNGQGSMPTDLTQDELSAIHNVYSNAGMISAGGGNSEQIAKGIAANDMTQRRADFANGKLSADKLLVMDGKPAVGYNGGVSYSLGDINLPQVTNGLFTANVNEKNASADAHTAQADKYRNDVKNDNAKAVREKLVPTFVGYDDSGNEVWQNMPSVAGSQIVKPSQDKGGFGLNFAPKDTLDLKNLINDSVGIPYDSTTKAYAHDFAPQLYTMVGNKADELAQKNKVKGLNQSILNQAVAETYKERPDLFNFMRGGELVGTDPKSIPMMPNAPKFNNKAPLIGGGGGGGTQVKKYPRPAGKTDSQLIEEANQAVRNGANPDAVQERLLGMGVRGAN